MADESQDKTEQKSHKKWEEARDKGELPKSQEIATFAVFSVMILYFTFTRTRGFDQIGAIMTDLLQFDRYLDIDRDSLDEFLLRPFLQAAAFLGPLFLVVIIVSTIVNMGQTGFQFASKKLEIDWNRLNPINGMKKYKSLKQYFEGLKSTIKIGLFGYIAYWTIHGSIKEVVELPYHDLRFQLNYMVALTLKIGMRIVMLMAVLAVGDYVFQWWQFQNKLKMTPREVKDELKDQEGDPLIRQRLRSLRMEMARRRMMADVPKADVIITNPIHYAVALRYDQSKMPAPWVCAKGRRHMAMRIREIARENSIPVIENPPIARALYQQVKVGNMVPSNFYRVIAELLAFIYMIKRRSPATSHWPGGPLRPKIKSSLIRNLGPMAPADPASLD